MAEGESYFAFKKRGHENPWLDFLRSLAIALVLARHGQRAFLAYREQDAQGLDLIMLNGWVGVDLFLVLSGYLITTNLIRISGQQPLRYLSTYLFRRAMRILPAYYAALFLTVVGFFPLYGVSSENLLQRVVYHLLLLQDYLPADINVTFWSLGVEEKFYLVAPMIVAVFAMSRRPIAFVVFASCLIMISPLLRTLVYFHTPISMNYEEFWPIYRSPFHAVLEPLVLGVIVAIIRDRDYLVLRAKTAMLLLMSSLLVLLIWLATHELMAEISLIDITIQPLLLAIVSAVSVFAASALSSRHLPGEAFFRIIARLSFTLYLIHYPLLPLSIALTNIWGGSAAVFWLVFLGMSLLLAILLHFAVEKPFLMARDAFGQRELRCQKA
ncbi:MAG: acyltransferase family protein [Geminicoccaceae bacterium]